MSIQHVATPTEWATTCTHLPWRRRQILRQNAFAQKWRPASRWSCQLVCLTQHRFCIYKYMIFWYSSFPDSVSMKPTVVTCCYHNSCCLLYVRSLTSSLSFSKSANTISLLERDPCALISPNLWLPNRILRCLKAFYPLANKILRRTALRQSRWLHIQQRVCV